MQKQKGAMEAVQQDNTPDQTATPEEDQQTLWEFKRKDSMECILRNLANGNSRARSCDYACVSRQTFYDWLKQDQDFAWRVQLSELDAASDAEAVLFRCALRAEEDPRYQRSLKLYLERQDKRREHLLAVQDERRKREQAEADARAQQQRQQEQKEQLKRERKRRRDQAIRAHIKGSRRNYPERGEPYAKPSEETLEVRHRRYHHGQAREKAHRRILRRHRPAARQH